MSGFERYLEDAKKQIGHGKRFSNPSAVAKAAGIAPSQVSRYLSEESAGNIAKFFKFLDSMNAQLIFPGEEMAGYELVPRVKAIAGAGESFVVDDDVAAMYAFRREFLEKIHVKASHAVMMYVSGDSMEPLISNGDTILFNSADTEPRDGHIYVCSFGDALMCKRLQMIPGGWQVCSENPRYSPISIVGDELRTFRVHGRVKWSGHVFE